MTYEQLLEQAFEHVKPIEECKRFEIKKVEGHHEGSKTIVTNFLQIANCLRRKAEPLAKFLFGELATSGEIAGQRLILIRKVSSQRINEKIEKYANLYVICQNCKKPDTELTEEDNKKFIRCLACGNKKQVA